MSGKILLVSLTLFILVFSFSEANSQVRYTPPAVTLGAAFNMNFATNDAYGRVGEIPGDNFENYSMRAGKGFDVYAKFGIGTMKRHRITSSISYNKMINYDRNSGFIAQVFSGNPLDVLHTNFNIWTGAVGYEYLFGAPCCNKQNIGLAVTFNSIGSVAETNALTPKIINAFRVGLQFSAGYEFLLGTGGQFGVNLGFKYNWANLFNPSNDYDAPGATEIHLNDGNQGPSGYTRWIGVTTINLGFNFYTGAKKVVFKK
jgi:hypothetical protein